MGRHDSHRSGTSPIRGTMPPRSLHLVSAALIRRWRGSDGKVSAYDKTSSRVRTLGPRGMGYSGRVHPEDPTKFEAVWQATETLLPSTLDIVESGAAFDQSTTVQLLRDCLAIHMARSLDLIAVDELAWRALAKPSIEELARDLAADPRTVESFRRRHAGLLPAGASALEMEARRLAAEIFRDAVREVEASSFRAERILALYEDAIGVVGRGGIEIGVARVGEFLIGDAPALAHPRGAGGVGPRGGTTWREASTIVMPLGRHHVVALGPNDGYVPLDGPAVAELNRRHAVAAHRFVAWHPEAHLESFVVELLSRSQPTTAGSGSAA